MVYQRLLSQSLLLPSAGHTSGALSQPCVLVSLCVVTTTTCNTTMGFPSSLRLAQAARRPVGGIIINRKVTTGTTPRQCQETEDKKTKDPVYELRTYTIYPQKMREFLDLTTKEFHLRTAHSKLVGYWTSEIGGLNQVVHLWEYSSLSERAGVRARLASDPEWLGRYISLAVPMFQMQDNALLTFLHGTHLTLPTSKGVYELQTLQLHGAPAVWSKALVEHVQACQVACRTEGSVAVGAWRSVLGARMAVVLWQHPDPDGCITLADASATLPETQTLEPLVTVQHSKLILPHAVSPLQ